MTSTITTISLAVLLPSIYSRLVVPFQFRFLFYFQLLHPQFLLCDFMGMYVSVVGSIKILPYPQ